PADVHAHTVLRNTAQGVVERVNPESRRFFELLEWLVAEFGPPAQSGDAWSIDLQNEPGVDDGAVLDAHGIRDCGDVLLVRLVVTVHHLLRDRADRRGSDERLFD